MAPFGGAVVFGAMAKRFFRCLRGNLTPTGAIAGERSMFALKGEVNVVANAKGVCPDPFAAGVAADAVFGGVLLSSSISSTAAAG